MQLDEAWPCPENGGAGGDSKHSWVVDQQWKAVIGLDRPILSLQQAGSMVLGS